MLSRTNQQHSRHLEFIASFVSGDTSTKYDSTVPPREVAPTSSQIVVQSTQPPTNGA
jgi:hypothetical protein